MIVNPDKHHAMVIGNTEHSFSFPLKPSIKLLGITVDNKLAFDDHVSQVCKKINNQINVIIRYRKLIGSDVMLKLYKAFILPHFQYCSSVWHFCSSRNTDKLESLNKRVLRAIFSDWNANYNELLNKSGTISLFNQRICNMLTSVFKCLHYNSYPLYMKDMFNVRNSNYSIRGTNILKLATPKTTTYGLNSFKYFAAKNWNSLPVSERTEPTILSFKQKITNLSFELWM